MFYEVNLDGDFLYKRSLLLAIKRKNAELICLPNHFEQQPPIAEKKTNNHQHGNHEGSEKPYLHNNPTVNKTIKQTAIVIEGLDVLREIASRLKNSHRSEYQKILKKIKNHEKSLLQEIRVSQRTVDVLESVPLLIIQAIMEKITIEILKDRQKSNGSEPKSEQALKSLILALCSFYIAMMGGVQNTPYETVIEIKKIQDAVSEIKPVFPLVFFNQTQIDVFKKELKTLLNLVQNNKIIFKKWFKMDDVKKKEIMEKLFLAWRQFDVISAHHEPLFGPDEPGFGINTLMKSEAHELSWFYIQKKIMNYLEKNTKLKKYTVCELVIGVPLEDELQPANGIRMYFEEISGDPDPHVQFVIDRTAFELVYKRGVKPSASFLEDAFKKSLHDRQIENRTLFLKHKDFWRSDDAERFAEKEDREMWQASCEAFELLNQLYQHFIQAAEKKAYILEVQLAIELDQKIHEFSENIRQNMATAQEKVIEKKREKENAWHRQNEWPKLENFSFLMVKPATNIFPSVADQAELKPGEIRTKNNLSCSRFNQNQNAPDDEEKDEGDSAIHHHINNNSNNPDHQIKGLQDELSEIPDIEEEPQVSLYGSSEKRVSISSPSPVVSECSGTIAWSWYGVGLSLVLITTCVIFLFLNEMVWSMGAGGLALIAVAVSSSPCTSSIPKRSNWTPLRETREVPISDDLSAGRDDSNRLDI